MRGFDPGFTDPHGGTEGNDWPPPPVFAPLISNNERAAIFGVFQYKRVAPDKDVIEILDDWESVNITVVTIPQLRGVPDAPRSGRIRVHKKVADQCQALFVEWDKAGMLPLVKTWGGAFHPRFVRGSSKTLSNHAFGSAFDINSEWNPVGATPAFRSRDGSVRELVALAHEYGFYWGGHFSRCDGMHFEVARVLG